MKIQESAKNSLSHKLEIAKLVFPYVLCAIFLLIILIPEHSYAAIKISPLHKVLVDDTNIKKVWTQVRNAVNYLVIAVLIFIAFANILRINLNNYAIKKFLPTLIFAAIASNFSYLICRMLVDASNVIMDLLMSGVKGNNLSGVAGAFDFTTDAYPVDPNNLNRSFVFILGEFVGAIAILILAFLFFIRNYVIYFLVGLAPLAFMSTIIPQAKNLFNQWWKMYLQWVFLPIISLFWLWIGGMWYSSGITGNSSISAERTTDFNSAVLALAFGLVCYYLAITTPLKAGGAVMGAWANAGKKVWGKTGGAATKWAGQEIKERAQAGYIDGKARMWHGFENSAIGNSHSVLGRARQGVIDWQNRNISNRQQRLLTIEGPKMVREHRIEDAKVDAAQRIFREPHTNPEVRGRMRKLLRGWVADEQKSLETARADDVFAEMTGSNFVDPVTGRVVTPGELHQNGYTTGHGYGRLMALIEKLKRIYRSDRDPEQRRRADYLLTGNIPTLPNGQPWQPPQGLNPLNFADMFQDVQTQTGRARAYADVFGMESSGYASSAVSRNNEDEILQSLQSDKQHTAAQAEGGNKSTSYAEPAAITGEEYEAAAKAGENLATVQHRRVAEGLGRQSTAPLTVPPEDVKTIASSLNLSEAEIARLAAAATQSTMDIADQVREKTKEANENATSEARIAGNVLNQISTAADPAARGSELLDLANQGKKNLAGHTRESLEDAVAAAELINPESSVLLRELSQRGDTDKLKSKLSTIFDTTDSQLSQYEDEAKLQEELQEFRKDPKAWKQQFVSSKMEQVPADAHREIIAEQITTRMASMPSADILTMKDMNAEMARHFDNMIASNAELTEKLGQLSPEERTQVVAETHDNLNEKLHEILPKMNSEDKLDVNKLRQAYIEAFMNPRVTKQYAKNAGDALATSLQKTNDILAKTQKASQPIHDVRPPADQAPARPITPTPERTPSVAPPKTPNIPPPTPPKIS